jgi:hypothetical protein
LGKGINGKTVQRMLHLTDIRAVYKLTNLHRGTPVGSLGPSTLGLGSRTSHAGSVRPFLSLAV